MSIRLPHTQAGRVATAIDRLDPHRCLVAIDGRSASGKSTLADTVCRLVPDAELIRGDDFYRVMSDAIRFDLAPPDGFAQDYDWQRLRSEVLEPLRRGDPADYRRYDWQTGELGPSAHATPARVTIAEGVYMSRPELRDLFDLVVWVDAPADVRDARQRARSDSLEWVERWHRAEDHYVATHGPQRHADIVVQGLADPPT